MASLASAIGPGFSPLVALRPAKVKKLASDAGFLTLVRAAAASVKKPAFVPPASLPCRS